MSNTLSTTIKGKWRIVKGLEWRVSAGRCEEDQKVGGKAS
jgi:hypothetical protein